VQLAQLATMEWLPNHEGVITAMLFGDHKTIIQQKISKDLDFLFCLKVFNPNKRKAAIE
jgi:hypothetical protein